MLQGEDAYFKSGYSGIFTDGTSGANFDSFKINPIDCWKY